ncbi:MAG TPA: hypothetical protein VJQ79_00950 [Acidimicrobiia bacterium]|nr:hypothetical protein [Acidimicrobiia bacterium]
MRRGRRSTPAWAVLVVVSACVATEPSPTSAPVTTPQPTTAATSTATTDREGAGWHTTTLPPGEIVVGFASLGADVVAISVRDQLRFRSWVIGKTGAEPLEDWAEVPVSPAQWVGAKSLAMSDGRPAVIVNAATDAGPTSLLVTQDAVTSLGDWMVSDLAELGETLIAVGVTSEPSQPALRISAGGSWEEVALPPETGVLVDLTSVAASDDRVVAVGRLDRAPGPIPVIWSEDGRHWTATTLPGDNDSPAAVNWSGSEFVVIGQSGASAAEPIWQSTTGLHWDRLPSTPEVFGDGGRLHEAISGSGPLAVAGPGIARFDPKYCYQDLSSCRQEFLGIWLYDGTWRRLRPAPEMAGGFGAIGTNGQVVAVMDRADPVNLFWTVGPLDGLMAPPFDLSAPDLDLPLAEDGVTLQTGVTYAKPFTANCLGWSQLGQFNGHFWIGDTVTGAPAQIPGLVGGDPGHPELTVFGTMELVTAERIEYAVPGIGVVAVYEPASDDYEPRACF